jgi:hypothetical protein
MLGNLEKPAPMYQLLAEVLEQLERLWEVA